MDCSGPMKWQPSGFCTVWFWHQARNSAQESTRTVPNQTRTGAWCVDSLDTEATRQNFHSSLRDHGLVWGVNEDLPCSPSAPAAGRGRWGPGLEAQRSSDLSCIHCLPALLPQPEHTQEQHKRNNATPLITAASCLLPARCCLHTQTLLALFLRRCVQEGSSRQPPAALAPSAARLPWAAAAMQHCQQPWPASTGTLLQSPPPPGGFLLARSLMLLAFTRSLFAQEKHPEQSPDMHSTRHAR